MGRNMLSLRPTCEVISWPSFPLSEAMKQQSHKRTNSPYVLQFFDIKSFF